MEPWASIARSEAKGTPRPPTRARPQHPSAIGLDADPPYGADEAACRPPPAYLVIVNEQVFEIDLMPNGDFGPTVTKAVWIRWFTSAGMLGKLIFAVA